MFGYDGMTRFPSNLLPNNRSSQTEPQDSGSTHSSLALNTAVFLESNPLADITGGTLVTHICTR